MNGSVSESATAPTSTTSLAFACVVVWVIAAASTGTLGIWLAIGGAAAALGVAVLELRRLRQLEEENRKLRGLVADLSLDKRILQDVIEKNVWSARTVQRDLHDGLPPAPMYPASLWSDCDCSGP